MLHYSIVMLLSYSKRIVAVVTATKTNSVTPTVYRYIHPEKCARYQNDLPDFTRLRFVEVSVETPIFVH